MTGLTTGKWAALAVSGLMLGTAALAGAPAGAQPEEGWTDAPKMQMGMKKQGMKKHGMKNRHMLMMLADKDGDRSISRAELDAFHRDWFARSDKNGDGALDAAEFAAMHQAMQAEVRKMKMQKKFAIHDSDGDGRLTLQEMKDHADKKFEMMDRNQDGELNREDRQKMKPFKKQ